MSDHDAWQTCVTPSLGAEAHAPGAVVSGCGLRTRNATPAAAMLDLVELAYAAPTAQAKVGQVLDRLRELVPFASALWLPVDAELELATGFQVGGTTPEGAIYLDGHAASDPFLCGAPCPDRLNTPVRLSVVGETAAARATLPGALAYPHALGTLAASHGHAVAFVRLQRTACQGEFTRTQADVVQRVLGHLARAVLTQRVIVEGTARLHCGVLVFADDGRLLYQTEAARRILEATPPLRILDFVNEQRRGLALVAGRPYRVKTIAPSQRSLLAGFAQPHPWAAWGDDRGVGAGSGVKVVQLAAARARCNVGERMRRMHLSARQIEVALMLLRGCTVAQIAARCGIQLQTAKEHVSAIYRKCGAASRAQFVAGMVGLAASTLD